MRIILASKSKCRYDLMRKSGLDFEVMPSNYEEDHSIRSNPLSLVKELALGKARDVAGRVSDSIVIGADSMVLLDGELMGKPKSRSEAFNQISKLLGRTHELITGLAVINTNTGEEVVTSCSTRVTFRRISDEEINDYLDSIDYLSLAGSYMIDGPTMLFVEGISGSYSNVVGLPMNKLAVILKGMGVKLFKR